jgi:hypothetical protein
MKIRTWQERFDANEHPHYTEYDAMNAEIDELRSEVKRLEAACNKFSEAELLQAQPVQEPVLYKKGWQVMDCPACGFDGARGFVPQPVQSPPLTDEQIDILQEEYDCFGPVDAPRLHDFARAIESALKGKP